MCIKKSSESINFLSTLCFDPMPCVPEKIYNYLPVIFFKERTRALDFPPAPLPPFLFLYVPPAFLFFGFYFFYALRGFASSYRSKKRGVSLSLGLVNKYIVFFALLTFNYLIHLMAVQYPVEFLFFGGFVFDGVLLSCGAVGLIPAVVVFIIPI